MTAHPSLPTRDLTLVLDVGKTHAKLLLIDAEGQVQAQHRCDNQPLSADQAYVALDVARLRAWWLQAVQATPAALRARVARLIATTHGAAFCALGPAAPGAPSADAAWAEGGLAFPPMDYEWDSSTSSQRPARPICPWA